jgi:hypothetical protein
MRTVIAEYETLGAAEQAVHTLELQIPILNIVIAPRREHGQRRRDHDESANFVVSMIGPRQSVRHAQTLLRTRAEPH